MDYLNLLQWPAMIVTIAASWLVASSREGRRNAAFWVFLVSIAMWAVWGWYTQAYALLVLQACLAAMNIRGAMKSSDATRG